MSKLLENISTAGFTLRPNSPDIKELFLDIKSQFEDAGITVLLDEKSANVIDVDGINFDTMCKNLIFWSPWVVMELCFL